MQDMAAHQNAAWMADRYRGGIDCEWLHPKALEVFDDAPEVWAATDTFLEAGDWLVWQLTHAGTGNAIGPSLVR